MQTKRDLTKTVLLIVSLIIFIGLSIEAGAFITNTVYTLMFNPAHAHQFWDGLNLGDLYDHDQARFVVITVLMIIVSVLKAVLFYIIVKICSDKDYDVSRPFNPSGQRFLMHAAYLSLGIGLFSYMGSAYYSNLIQEGVELPLLEKIKLSGGDVWLFISVILFVTNHVFKRGMEIQNENDLTF